MSQWNAMTYEGKDTILRVVKEEAARFIALAEPAEAWEAPTACRGWTTCDIVAHIIDTTEGYFQAFDAARGDGDSGEPHGLPAMAARVNEQATSFRGTPQAEMMERLQTDLHKMMEILEPLSPEDWSGLTPVHPYMGPVPAFFYAAGQLMDYGVHSWDIREGTGKAHALTSEAADLLVPFMFALLQGTVRDDAPDSQVGIRLSGNNGGDTRVTITNRVMTYEPGDVSDLPATIEFDAAGFVLRSFQRCNTGTIHGDVETATAFLNSFFRI